MRKAPYQWSVVSSQRSVDRRAFTLVELLIVVAIIVMVSVATVPLVKPALDTRRIRESGRLVSSQFAAGQSLALYNGRSAGVWLERMSNEPTASMDLFLCEVPEPYSGDSETSTVMVNAGNGTVTIYSATASPTGGTDTAWIGLLRPNDLIRFNSSGPFYKLTVPPATVVPPSGAALVITDGNGFFQPSSSTSNTTFSITPVDPDDFNTTGTTPAFRHLPPAAFTPTGWFTPYEILEQPVKTSDAPVQLPAGDIVDLNYSGMGGATGFLGQFGFLLSGNASQPVIVTFDKTGALDSLYLSGTKYPTTGPLYFLIGKRDELASLQAQPGSSADNSTDMENLWVAINAQTGLITTAEMAASSGGFFGLQAARAFATSAQTMGGR